MRRFQELMDPSNWRRYYTPFVMIAGLLFYVAYDILAEVFGGDDATISRTTYRSGTGYLGLVVVISALMVHLFFPRHDSLPLAECNREHLKVLAAWLAGAALGWCFFRQQISP